MRFDATLLGLIAAFCTTVAFIPQVLLIWRRKSAAGVSTGMYCVFCFGVLLWLIYGVIIEAWPIAINNGITLVLACSVLVMKWAYRNNP
ncbi:MtN3 and saliva related transmembrane protein [Duganella sp. 3397]|uniref:PQ loop repeat protein n=1 Tax=Duganella phyllosphaerae TaxID=762836 RepID=A0A1E7WDI6_9BURK|nr:MULTISPECIES: SemiSWEET transporter [Duganella]MDR7049987.1 MtN3 and saliva related transmembrane protein [Duganella sp. 3397]OEZ96018.1 PQ loop repeat protein [Duganella phyllosphaerae]